MPTAISGLVKGAGDERGCLSNSMPKARRQNVFPLPNLVAENVGLLSNLMPGTKLFLQFFFIKLG